MLEQKNRLKKNKEIEAVFKRGRFFREGFLVLRVLENNLNLVRFAFSIGKNFSKKAVLRNKAKRKIREVVRKELSKITGAADAVFAVRFGAVRLNNKEKISDFLLKIEENTKNLLKKSGLKKQP